MTHLFHEAVPLKDVTRLSLKINVFFLNDLMMRPCFTLENCRHILIQIKRYYLNNSQFISIIVVVISGVTHLPSNTFLTEADAIVEVKLNKSCKIIRTHVY